MNIYIGNLDYKVREKQLQELFEQYGEVTSVRVVFDKETRRSKGFAFVEMPDEEEAKNAIEALNGQTFSGRDMVVNEARPKTNNYSRNKQY